MHPVSEKLEHIEHPEDIMHTALTREDLSNADLRGMDLRDYNLRGCDFTNAVFNVEELFRIEERFNDRWWNDLVLPSWAGTYLFYNSQDEEFDYNHLLINPTTTEAQKILVRTAITKLKTTLLEIHCDSRECDAGNCDDKCII